MVGGGEERWRRETADRRRHNVLLVVHDRVALTNFQTDTRIDIESIEIYITYIMECIGLAIK